ncbi:MULTISPECIES: hypothetical protein [Pontibacillus]|uniref:DUF4181 domain-containing protein n=1 Tax=Pontibacillus chungwhensis TaxID=265426 RepID=A0ABY8V126_9BACI|nr:MULTISPECIES: hypothetical protein [Pontibacillus]MCD5324353.1 hypothetical protein [Pontibacillus sp. HN14]WIF99348.1 hypothetical protein QNI29_06740 [Pontibacillus chungwhensis]
MNQAEIHRLRKKQYLIANLWLILIPVIFGIFSMQDVTFKQFYFGLMMLLFLAFAIELVRYFTRRYALTEDMQKLLEYERDQLGAEAFQKERKQSLFTQGFLFVVIGLQFLMADRDPFLFSETMWWVLVILMLILIPTINWSMHARAKKIDSGNADYKALNKTMLMIGIITFALTFILTLSIVFFFA